jgi:hypothetical protein
MIGRLIYCGMAVLVGGLLAGLLLWLEPPAPVRADPSVHCVNLSGSGCGGECGDCYATVQQAVAAASTDHVIRIAGGTYAPGGTVAAINKQVTLRGGYSQNFDAFDPDVNQTVLDAQWGGAVVSITNAGGVYLQHLTLTHGNGDGNCGGAGCGGGVYASNTNFYMSECVVTNNVASTAGGALGGGVYVFAPGGIVQIWNSRVVSNTSSASSTLSTQYGYGGGIFINGGDVSVWGNEILDNVGSVVHSGSGGLHLVNVTSANVTTNTIQGNKACLGDYWCGGGGLYVDNSAQVNVAANRIENNWAAALAGYGGGVRVSESDVHLTGNTIISNTTGSMFGYGGGVCVESSVPVTLSNNLIIQNHASSQGGGVSVIRSGSPGSRALLVNNTIADNGVTGVVAPQNATVTLQNNIIAGHGSGLSQGNSIDVVITADTNLFWNISEPIVGINAILLEPRLWSNYRLRDGSPALDQGLNISWLTTDIEGRARPWNEYDLGAYEGVWWGVFLPLIRR